MNQEKLQKLKNEVRIGGKVQSCLSIDHCNIIMPWEYFDKRYRIFIFMGAVDAITPSFTLVKVVASPPCLTQSLTLLLPSSKSTFSQPVKRSV